MDDIFSKSNFGDNTEDEEEALKWAAISRLPTYSRMKKGLLLGSRGREATEIDVQKLGAQEKMELMERLMKNPEEDSEKFLLKLKNRIDRYNINCIYLFTFLFICITN